MADISRMIGYVSEVGRELHYSGTMSQIFAEVGMRPKVMVGRGEVDERFIKKLGGSVLGYTWDACHDDIKMKFSVNVTGKSHGVQPGEDLTRDNLNVLEDAVLTLRIVIWIVCSMYDPLGIMCP